MRESLMYGSVRGREVTRVPTTECLEGKRTIHGRWKSDR
jgi:hypothetical protein